MGAPLDKFGDPTTDDQAVLAARGTTGEDGPRTTPVGSPDRSAAYHPDPTINAEIEAQALEGEHADLAAGYAPKFWRCPDCGAGHSRGHFQTIGAHRCMGCGYVGTGGTMHTHDAAGRLA